MSTAREAVEDVRTRIFWGCIFLIVLTTVWLALISTINTSIKHTYEQPHDAPGNLLTYRGGKDHMLFIGLYVTPWVIIILLLFVIAYPDSKNIRNLHFLFSMLLWIFFLVCFIIWSLDWSRANLQTSANAANLFNDKRWCLVNFAISPGYCANTAAPPSGTQNYLINQSSLGVDGLMLAIYWLLFAYWFFTGVQLLYVRRRFLSALEVFRSERDNEKVLLPSQDESTPDGFYYEEKQIRSNNGNLVMPTRMKKLRK